MVSIFTFCSLVNAMKKVKNELQLLQTPSEQIFGQKKNVLNRALLFSLSSLTLNPLTFSILCTIGCPIFSEKGVKIEANILTHIKIHHRLKHDQLDNDGILCNSSIFIDENEALKYASLKIVNLEEVLWQ